MMDLSAGKKVLHYFNSIVIIAQLVSGLDGQGLIPSRGNTLFRRALECARPSAQWVPGALYLG
jgi:hypothetical protein